MLQKHYNNVTVIPEEETTGIAAPRSITSQALPERASNTETSQKSNQEQSTQQHLVQEESLAQPSTQASFQQENAENMKGDKIAIIPIPQENDETFMRQEDRLRQAFQELKEEGQRISGRALAQRAHVRRATCLEWLRTYEQTQQEHTHSQSQEQNTETLQQVIHTKDTVLTLE
jgi:hypothetical protein